MEFAGIELFVDRARSARADLELTTNNIDAVVAVCQKLEGIPLAIELAAEEYVLAHGALDWQAGESGDANRRNRVLDGIEALRSRSLIVAEDREDAWRLLRKRCSCVVRR